MRFKYLGRAEYAGFFGKMMTEFGKTKGMFRDADLIVPVPIHRQRRIRRGYNQAELLAEQISLLTGIPMQRNLVLRRKKTKAQKALGRESRRQNLMNAFTVPDPGAELLKGKHVLLVDDIYTTGSTADAVSIRLLEAGAASVSVLCLAVSPGFS